MRNLFPEITKRQNGIFDFGAFFIRRDDRCFF